MAEWDFINALVTPFTNEYNRALSQYYSLQNQASTITQKSINTLTNAGTEYTGKVAYNAVGGAAVGLIAAGVVGYIVIKSGLIGKTVRLLK